jgi:hypothetical protein
MVLFLRAGTLLLLIGLGLGAWPQLPPASAAGLPIPAGITVEQDDHNAILQWDFDPQNPNQPLPAGVAGYKITWGPASTPSAFSKLTEERIIQLQPLENGQPYVAQVQSVDYLGHLSAPSALIHFTGDPARVDALRARMNGFFDDFNLPQGLPDERKWNAAYSRCNADWSNGFFINDQFHAHNTVFSGNCDRAQSISRPRAALDFSDNGTRTIVFDFDGELRRNIWYLDLVPRLMDITGQVNIEDPQHAADPAGGLRFRQNEQDVAILAFRPDGVEQKLARINDVGLTTLADLGLKQVPNVRRHWEIHISRTQAEIWINGQRVLATAPNAFHLTQDRYYLQWNVFAYNAAKANVPLVLVHWDNFGFDAPAGAVNTIVTHNYRLYNTGTDFTKAYGANSPAVKQLNIPDPVAGATARRLMFTLQMDDYDWYKWSPSDRVTVNGTSLAIPMPASSAQPPIELQTLVSTLSPYTVVLPLPEGVLRTGQNEIRFATAGSSVHNIHVELDFNRASEPAYTPPAQALSGAVLPQIRPVGPNAWIAKIGAADVPIYDGNLNDAQNFNQQVGGVVPVAVEVHNNVALQSTGSNLGVRQVDLLVDGSTVASLRTDSGTPAPAVLATFSLDTRRLPNGVHELYVRAYDARCTPSMPDYFYTGGISGLYYPLHISVRNGAAAAAAADPRAGGTAPAASPARQLYLPLLVSGRLLNSSCGAATVATTSAGSGGAPPAFAAPAPDALRDEQQVFLCEW